MITLNNVTKQFAGMYLPALNKLTLHIPQGEFCVVIGSNGSGKSTLFKLITQELEPCSGTLHTKAKIAHVTQDINIGTIPELSLLENMALTHPHPATLKRYKRHTDAIVQKLKTLGVNLIPYLHQPLKSLSGGQRQMIATLMAATSKSDVLLLDEHTSALDPQTHMTLMEYTANIIKQRNLTALMITHKMDDAIKYGNRLIMLHKGNIALDISQQAKATLTPKKLIDLFQSYENETLLNGA